MHDLTSQIDDIKARWMTGGSAETACPAPWRTAMDAAPNLTLLALTGQFTRLATTPSTGTLTARQPLPRLDLPTVPEAVRPIFRRVLDGKTTPTLSLLELMAARGVTAHPADWMPKASTEVPDTYGPWIDWVSQDRSGTDDEVVTQENWDEWLPHARRAALAQMRRINPEDARALIAAKAADVPAEQRLRLIAVLQEGLSEADEDVLNTLAGDRSGKVKALASNLLARLGASKADAETLEEFAAFFETQKAGMLSRKQVVVARKLKNNAQKARRWELANALPLTAFADAMGTSPDQLIAMFDCGDGTDDLIAMTAATGTSEHALALLERLDAAKPDIDFSPLLARLDDKDRITTAMRLSNRDTNGFRSTLAALGSQLGTLDYATLSGSPSAKTLQKQLAKDDGRVAATIETALTNLGLIASQEAAEKLLDDLTTHLGLMAADPRLAMLRLNALLPIPPKET